MNKLNNKTFFIFLVYIYILQDDTRSIKYQVNALFCMYLFYNLLANLHVSNDCFFHHQEFIHLLYLQLYTNHANVAGLFIELVTLHGTYNVK